MRRAVCMLAAMALAMLLASGVAWAVTEIGTNGPDTLRGTNGDDNLFGKGGNDELVGLQGRDNLLGGAGKDVVFAGIEGSGVRGDKNLVGGSGNDLVIGGLGADNVVGEEGNDLVDEGPPRESSTDKLSAGGGNDVVGARNEPAFKDIVTCGGGFDWVFADKKDVVAPDCEKVADSASETEEVFESIPASFWMGLPL
jgi:Ca2+-binding RTX toxin-like protein